MRCGSRQPTQSSGYVVGEGVGMGCGLGAERCGSHAAVPPVLPIFLPLHLHLVRSSLGAVRTHGPMRTHGPGEVETIVFGFKPPHPFAEWH